MVSASPSNNIFQRCSSSQADKVFTRKISGASFPSAGYAKTAVETTLTNGPADIRPTDDVPPDVGPTDYGLAETVAPSNWTRTGSSGTERLTPVSARVPSRYYLLAWLWGQQLNNLV
jgi:hypothetical protein